MKNCHCGNASEHDHLQLDDDKALASLYTLYTKINFECFTCLNEVVDGSGKAVFRRWEDRMDKSLFVESDVDEELLFNVPFCGVFKLKSIIIMGGSDCSRPTMLRLFKNREQMSFDETHAVADQEFALLEDPTGEVQYPLRTAKFSDVYHLSIYIPRNGGAERTLVYYIGLHGEYSGPRRDSKIVNAVYETRAMPDDHKAYKLEENHNFVM